MNKLAPITYKWNEEEISLTPEDVRKYISTDERVTDKEVYMFMKLCQAQKLNPFVREAYLIKYGSSPANMVTGKETFLKRAEANKNFDGYELTDEGKVPEYSVTCKVYRKNLAHPITVTVDYKEYVGTNSKGEINRMWKSKPKTMLRKVALMQALRETFPIALGGLYEETELDQRTEAKIIEADSTEKVKTTYLGNRVKPGDEQEKNQIEKIDNIGKTEVKDEPRLLSEEEAQKEQNKALEQKQEHDKEWQDKTRRTWHNLVKKMYSINYFSDEPSYRAWMKQELNGKISYTKLTDAERVEGIGKMVGYANKYEQEKEK